MKSANLAPGVPGRVTLTDTEKSIGTAHNHIMDHARGFYNRRNLTRNMCIETGGGEKARSNALYASSLSTSSRKAVELVKLEYRQVQYEYLDKNHDPILYRAAGESPPRI